MLIDLGLLDPFVSVATHWPDFPASGQHDVESATSPAKLVSGWMMPFTLDDMYDRPKDDDRTWLQAPRGAPPTPGCPAN